jgi:hypothetical protein
MFLDCYESMDAAGEALHDAIIDAAPTLTTLFTMPRAVSAMRFREGLHQIINSLAEPDDVKNLVPGIYHPHPHPHHQHYFTLSSHSLPKAWGLGSLAGMISSINLSHLFKTMPATPASTYATPSSKA